MSVTAVPDPKHSTWIELSAIAVIVAVVKRWITGILSLKFQLKVLHVAAQLQSVPPTLPPPAAGLSTNVASLSILNRLV